MKIAREDRVRARTDPTINDQLDEELAHRIRFYAAQDAQTISERLDQLDREWDIERLLETNAASLSLAGFVLGATLSRKWLILPLIISGFLLQHALHGWCPPVPLLRKLKVRTRLEIDQEKYALKILRGDFDGVGRSEQSPGMTRNAEAIVGGVKA
jgi:hypothetical protein